MGFCHKILQLYEWFMGQKSSGFRSKSLVESEETMDRIDLQFQTVELLSPDVKRQIMELWNREYPAKLVHADLTAFGKYLHALEKPTHILVRLNDRIVGWATKFYRDQSR